MNESIILVRYCEIHLKGLNRPFFERKLEKRMRTVLCDFGAVISREQGRVYVSGVEQGSIDAAVSRLKHVFGVHSVSVARVTGKDWQEICAASREVMNSAMAGKSFATFKVFAKRSDKRFPLNSEEICRELGHDLLETMGDSVAVDVHEPEIKLTVEVRERVYIYTDAIMCAGGLPTGTAGRAALLISGGIDSPVAGYMLAKRGLELSAVHFYSYPYTSERAKDKVIELTRLLSEYTGGVKLHIVPFTEIQLAIHEKCPEKETTLIMRRLMMKISERIAVEDEALALITGESLGQVASQTLEALCATNDAVSMPVFRPLIGMDKTEIMSLARKIGTYETSILPYEDCCTVFVPKHPTTKPKVSRVRESESVVDFSEMVEKAIEDSEVIIVTPHGR